MQLKRPEGGLPDEKLSKNSGNPEIIEIRKSPRISGSQRKSVMVFCVAMERSPVMMSREWWHTRLPLGERAAHLRSCTLLARTIVLAIVFGEYWAVCRH